MSNASMFYTYDKAQFLLESLYDEVVNETVPVTRYKMNDIFKVSDYERATFVSYNVAGPGLPQERQMLQDVPPVSYNEGEPVSFPPFYWGGQMAVPTELIRIVAKFGESDSETASKIGTYARFMRDMKRNGHRRADLECLNLLINGTSTNTRYSGRYGEPLFSTNHTSIGDGGSDQSNLTVNMSLTEPNLNAVISALGTQKDENGAPIDHGDGWTLVTGPALETTGWKILNTEKKVGSAENDANRVYSMRSKIDHVVWPEIDADFTGWWVIAKNHGLHFKWMDKPYFDKQSDISTNSLRYSMNEGGRAFWTTWRGTYASLPS